MARRNLVERMARLMTFLVGLRHATAADALEARGLTVEERARGWRLLEAVASPDIRFVDFDASQRSRLMPLVEWGREWLAIAATALEFHHPSAFESLMGDLDRSDGPSIIVTVRTFLDRLDDVGQSDPTIIEALASRRLDAEERARGRELVRAFSAFEPAQLVDQDEMHQRARAAEEAMWTYYLEWSSIARTTIKNKRDLRRLGFAYGTNDSV
jgi:hypothetical protein